MSSNNAMESNCKHSSRLLADEEEYGGSSLKTGNHGCYTMEDSNYAGYRNLNGHPTVSVEEHDPSQNIIGQGRKINVDMIEAQITNDVERALRATVILSTVYLLGVYHPGGSHIMENVLKVALIAWCTILLIQCLAFMSSMYVSGSYNNSSSNSSSTTAAADGDRSEQKPLLGSNMKKYNGSEGDDGDDEEEEGNLSLEEPDGNEKVEELSRIIPKRLSLLKKKKYVFKKNFTLDKLCIYLFVSNPFSHLY
jgi:hypothetical protein